MTVLPTAEREAMEGLKPWDFGLSDEESHAFSVGVREGYRVALASYKGVEQRAYARTLSDEIRRADKAEQRERVLLKEQDDLRRQIGLLREALNIVTRELRRDATHFSLREIYAAIDAARAALAVSPEQPKQHCTVEGDILGTGDDNSAPGLAMSSEQPEDELSRSAGTNSTTTTSLGSSDREDR